MLFEKLLGKDAALRRPVSEALIRAVRQYLDAHYIGDHPTETDDRVYFAPEEEEITLCRYSEEEAAVPAPEAMYAPPVPKPKLYDAARPIAYGKADMDFSFLEQLDAGFSETLLGLIDRSGKKDSEVYKKANVDRKLFSKIRTNRDYKPSKTTALAFAFALELDLEQTRDLIGRAGFVLSHSSKFDLIVEYFLLQNNHDLFALNEVLLAFDQPLVGG